MFYVNDSSWYLLSAYYVPSAVQIKDINKTEKRKEMLFPNSAIWLNPPCIHTYYKLCCVENGVAQQFKTWIPEGGIYTEWAAEV